MEYKGGDDIDVDGGSEDELESKGENSNKGGNCNSCVYFAIGANL